MATHINDLVSAVVVKTLVAPQSFAENNPSGSSVDLEDGDGPCFAIQMVGEVDGDAGITGRIEESADQSTWTAISGAAFSPTTAAGIQVIEFARTCRYVRWASAYTEADGDDLYVAAVVLQPRKTF